MQNQNRRFGAFSSSEDPDKLAMKVRGAILAFSVIIIWLGGRFLHVTLTPKDVMDLATQAGGAVASIMIAYGTVRSLVIWGIGKWHTRTV